jgi:transposase
LIHVLRQYCGRHSANAGSIFGAINGSNQRANQQPELGKLNRKQIAALVGIAPMNRDSGTFQGKRKIQGGRAKVRTALYLSTMTAIQHHPTIKPMYQRLVAARKPRKVAIVACMPKQLSILNAMVKTRTHWQPDFAQKC